MESRTGNGEIAEAVLNGSGNSNGHGNHTSAPSIKAPATLGIHGDDLMNEIADVAPPIHVSTIFRYTDDPDRLVPAQEHEHPDREAGGVATGSSHIYSRHSAPNSSRLELLLTAITGGPSLTYASGLSAFHALLTYLNPKVVAIGEGYHGCHGVLAIFQRLTKCKIVDLFDEKCWDEAGLGKGDVVHVESPVNPTGLAWDISHFAKLAHARGAVVTVDSTFGPPPLQDPFACGADFIMHSGTKYIGGHSDMLCGTLSINRKYPRCEDAYWGLFEDRVCLGAVMGSLEGWLGVRSMRTLDLRVRRQSENCTKLVAFLANCLRETEDTLPAASSDPDTQPDAKAAAAVKAVVLKVEHASLQHEDMHWLKKQMPGGFGPVFALWLHDPKLARAFPSKLQFFHHSTSLGGVESLIEWRRMSDVKIDERLLRVSVGVEDWKDLRDDLVAACVQMGPK